MKRPLHEPSYDTFALPVHAVASGVRSALVQAAGTWYRLKGCGNGDAGFIVRTTRRSDGTSWRDIRGSAFPHTAVRELAMSARLAAHLEPRGIIGCNQPLGWYEYTGKELPLGPEFPITCIVERTLGDRRFGTHVLAGLQLLLPLLLDVSLLDATAIMSCFPAGRPGAPRELVTTAELMMDYSLGTMHAGSDAHSKGFTWPNVRRDETTLAYACTRDCALPERPPIERPCQWTAAGSQAMSPAWIAVWDRALEQYAAALSAVQRRSAGAHPTSTVLAYFFSRCGHDAGRILQGMHSMRVSWGTYQDAMCRRDLDEWHCNAHANNLVLIPEMSPALQRTDDGATCFLSYLDLDMAFSETAFVDMTPGAPAVVGASPDAFSRLLWQEHVSLMEVLAGSDSSNGVPGVAREVVASQAAPLPAVSSLLYDTLILAYLRGYTQETRFPVADFDRELHAAAHALARLAVIVMAEYVA